MNRLLAIITIIFAIINGFGQRTAKVSTSYTYYAPESMSVEEAKRIALDRAKIQAIADEFGTVVSQSSATIVTTRNGDTENQFFAYGGSDIKGEWIETIDNPEFKIRYEDDILVVNVSTKGIIREFLIPNIDIEVLLLGYPDISATKDLYTNGQPLYVYFKSPTKGFIQIYLRDNEEKRVYRLLPYKRSQYKAKYIEPQIPYIFFSNDNADEEDRLSVDEYNLFTQFDIVINDVIVLFAKEEDKLPMASKQFSVPLNIFEEQLTELRRNNYIQVLSNQFKIQKSNRKPNY